MKTLYGIYWLLAVVYAFVYWGFWWGVLNIIIPYAPIYDLVVKMGRIK